MSPISTSPGPLFQSPTAPCGSKRSRSPSKGSSPKARHRVRFPEGSAVTGTLDGFDGSKDDCLAAVATLAMAHQVLAGPVEPTAPPS